MIDRPTAYSYMYMLYMLCMHQVPYDPSLLVAPAYRTLVRASHEALRLSPFPARRRTRRHALADPELPYQEQLAVRLRLGFTRAAEAEGLLPLQES